MDQRQQTYLPPIAMSAPMFAHQQQASFPLDLTVHHPQRFSPYFRNDAGHKHNTPPPPQQQHPYSNVQEKPLNLSVLHRNRFQSQPPATNPPAAAVSLPSARPLLWQQLDDIETRLNRRLAISLRFPERVAAVYNPTEYAASIHRAYLQRFLRHVPRVLFVGMNPGPWGMCQTGVPFGWVPAVRDWMRLDGVVERPVGELEKYPVRGMLCERSEVSGKRFWTVMREVFGGETADGFFGKCFVHNLCPLAMFEARGRNVTPAELAPDVRDPLEQLCAEALLEFLALLGPTVRVVSIGGYVDKVLRRALRRSGASTTPAEMLCMPHPSPRATGNSDWAAKARAWLEAHAIGPHM